MRQIVLDTETTGLDPAQGHRIIEIGCVELVNRRATGRNFHHYLNPDRDVDEAALAVHGVTRAELEGKPRFAEIADELIAFIRGAELVIHNASFDVSFLNAELAKLSTDALTIAQLCRVLDTLGLARSMHPGQRNSLDALCKRYDIDNSKRDLHGALLDARILADVYLAMTGGQGALALTQTAATGGSTEADRAARALLRPPAPLRIVGPSESELAAHAAMLGIIAKASGGRCLWSAEEALRSPAPSAAQRVTCEPTLSSA